MTWSTSTDVRDLLEAAGELLAARPVENTVLLTEAAYLDARPTDARDQLHGWWRDRSGAVAGAFLQAPGHAPVLSVLPAAAVPELVDVLPDVAAVGVDGRLVDEVVVAWGRVGNRLVPMSRIRLCRLGELRAPPLPAGGARVATAADRDLLVSWFHALMAAHPGDPSELAYVVDDPLTFGGITLWEVDGVPVAMAGRSRVVAGMTRLSAVHETEPGRGYGTAAFVAAAAAAQQVAGDVLVLVGADDDAALDRHRSWGFRPVLDRVMLSRRR